MFNATCLIKTDIDTVNKCRGKIPTILRLFFRTLRLV